MKFCLFALLCLFGLEQGAFGTTNFSTEFRTQKPEIFLPLPHFPTRPHSLEFVKIVEGKAVENDALMAQFLSPQTIQEIKRLRFEWLMLRNADIDIRTIAVTGNRLEFQVYMGVRYKQYGNFIVNGTVTGQFAAQLTGDTLTSIQRLNDFEGSQPIENAVLWIWRQANYDMRPFLDSIITDVLTKTLSEPTFAERVRQMIKTPSGHRIP